MLSAFKECPGIRLKSALAREFEIGSNVGDNGVGIVQSFVNASKKKVYITISLRGVEVDRIEGTVLGFRDLAQRELGETETIFADG